MDKLDEVLTNINTSVNNILESQKEQATKDDFNEFKNAILAALSGAATEEDYKDAFNKI